MRPRKILPDLSLCRECHVNSATEFFTCCNWPTNPLTKGGYCVQCYEKVIRDSGLLPFKPWEAGLDMILMFFVLFVMLFIGCASQHPYQRAEPASLSLPQDFADAVLIDKKDFNGLMKQVNEPPVIVIELYELEGGKLRAKVNGKLVPIEVEAIPEPGEHSLLIE